MLIAINPGHCPKRRPDGSMYDSGAVGVKTTEAEYVEKVAHIVCGDLEKVGYEVLFIQENELQDICDKSNYFKADVFVSIHTDAFDCTKKGTTTYYCSYQGFCLADYIQQQLLDTMGHFGVDRGVREKGYYVLLNTDAVAALCEIDFQDNPEREDYMITHMTEIAHAIARGITDYFEYLGD